MFRRVWVIFVSLLVIDRGLTSPFRVGGKPAVAPGNCFMKLSTPVADVHLFEID
jgi:hypothetical protein